MESKHFIMAKLGKIFLFLVFHLPLWSNIREGLYKTVQLVNQSILKALYFAKQSSVVFASQFSGQISYSYQEGLSFVPKYEQLHHVTCYDKSWTESFRINQGTVQTYFNHFYNTLFSNSIHWHLYADLKIGKYNSQRINFD